MTPGTMSSLRQQALERLAALAASQPALPHASADSSRIFGYIDGHLDGKDAEINGNSSGSHSAATVPMTFRELEVLMALCKAAPKLQNAANAEKLLGQLSPYVAEAPLQAIAPSPFLKAFPPSPWEALTEELVLAVLAIGSKFPSLHEPAKSTISTYVDNWSREASSLIQEPLQEDSSLEDEKAAKQLLSAAVLATSMLGFLGAVASEAHFWTAQEQSHLIHTLQQNLSEKYMIACETSFSTIRNSQNSSPPVKSWKTYLKKYAVEHRPLGAMLLQQDFMRLVEKCAALCVTTPDKLRDANILDVLMLEPNDPLPEIQPGAENIVGMLADLASEKLSMLDEASDYLQIGTAWQQRVGYAARASSYVTLLCCAILSDDDGDQGVLMDWLEGVLADPSQVANHHLASVALRCMAILGKMSTTFASELSRSLPRFLLHGPLPTATAAVTANSLLFILKLLPRDTVITTLYGLGNHLSPHESHENYQASVSYLDVTRASVDHRDMQNGNEQTRHGSTVSVSLEPTPDSSNVHNNVIQAVVNIAKGYEDQQVTALALSMLVQKVGRVSKLVDLKVIEDTSVLAAGGTDMELRSILKLYVRLAHDGILEDQSDLVAAVSEARNYLGQTLQPGSRLQKVYVEHILETIISIGDISSPDASRKTDVDLVSKEMALLLQPLAYVAANVPDQRLFAEMERLPSLQRDAWFNLVIHGFSYSSAASKKYSLELGVLASASRPLIAEEHADRLESDIELNTVLRRGMHPTNTSKERQDLTRMLPQCESDIKSLDYPELIFLKSAHLVETYRATQGNCTETLNYFVDPDLKRGAMGNCMSAVALGAVDTYLMRTLPGKIEAFSAPFVAVQLARFFEGCCHRISRVQQVAYTCAQRIIDNTPSALCQKTAIFTLLDLLTIMWSSCLDEDIDEYSWKSTYTSPSGLTTVSLSDDYAFRRQTLQVIHSRAKEWIVQAINIAPLDIKGLLQTYLSDHEDDRTYGHMSLGRSLAVELGAAVPLTDQRLTAIESDHKLNINTASDFVAQYTARQEYKIADSNAALMLLQKSGATKAVSDSKTPSVFGDGIAATLNRIEQRLHRREAVNHDEMHHALHQAAAYLSGAKGTETSTLTPFMRIPFASFTKQSIKMGVSLWLGVIKENSRMESAILVEVIEGWISTIRRKIGIFSHRLTYRDPFFTKEEFAPSDKKGVTKQQRFIQDLIAPHFRVLQALSSHYNATRLSNESVERSYQRFLIITLDALTSTTAHPLAREVHFHVILLGLKFLKHNTSLDAVAQWRLKDLVLSAGLAWFAHPPRWSFGGNRVQLKAEVQLLADVQRALQQVASLGSSTQQNLLSLQDRHELLQLLLRNEQSRLWVWLSPLEHRRHHHLLGGSNSQGPSQAVLSQLLPAAWTENIGIALHMISRFRYPGLKQEVRQLLLSSPERALDQESAVPLLLGLHMPNDVSSQLKYLLYWTPVDPITAVTYFTPAYKSDPFVIQYAVRALDSHSVDVTFFYVPQIVQTLRYDDLGYVERYIVETANFSQLFAHQIIWNMKANAYKDEDSQVPDPVKPTLDKVMENLISNFSEEDRDFYRREFDFFNEITGISGKLRPFIKAPKSEKKQKIEEELRRIQVDVGVYLPSNPEGVVVGIDRKSGKPLQSHAKAPYMATFRVRKELGDDTLTGQEELLESENNVEGGTNGANETEKPKYVEVWQSAMFKVGDDCRQDILALQMIAAFRGIFQSIGLDVYVFPYRVTATAPGCGVIDVLPNSISRDMLGREAVNGLKDYFVSKYGGEESIAYQEARNAFVKSMAAYSVISYLLQFKDRHNGNIMVDDVGHILHVDFGFCFDIAPGGVKFERAPFKLTNEMLAVMGGASTATAQSFRWFEELCVKVFLASRLHVDQLAHIVSVMLDSGLPCFKPETMQNFRDRFVSDRSERDAAEFMRDLVRKSKGAYSTKGYDQFQLLTNGIPY